MKIISSLSIAFNYTPFGSNVPVQTTTTDGSLLIGNLSSSNINTGVGYIIGNFIFSNPPSTKTVSISINSQTIINKVAYLIDSNTIYITANSSVLNSANILMSNNFANQISNYQISFTLINPLITNSFIIIYFPSEISILSTAICTSNFGNCSTNSV